MTSYHACPVTFSNRWLAGRPTSRGVVLLAHLVKAEIVSPLFTGFSLMQAWVTQPSPGYNSLVIGKFRDPRGDAQYSGPLYRDPVSSSSLALASSSTPATPSSNPRVPIATSPNHVRIQPSGPVGGFFCHRGGYSEAPRSEVSDPGNLSSSSGTRASHTDPQI